MLLVLLLKLSLVPLLIWGISMAGRIWGPSVAGWLSAFPVVTGPILFFISLEQGTPFGAAAATATLMAILAHLSFGLAYSWAATRWAWRTCLAMALVAYAACLALLNAVHVGFNVQVGVILAVLLIARRLFPALPRAATMAATPAPKPASSNRAEMLLRMVAGAVLVMAVTLLASGVGPRLSGLLAMFPVLGVVLAVFSHRQTGAAFTITLLRNMVLGYFAFAAFCVLLAKALPLYGLASGFALAVAAAFMVQATTLRLLK